MKYPVLVEIVCKPYERGSPVVNSCARQKFYRFKSHLRVELDYTCEFYQCMIFQIHLMIRNQHYLPRYDCIIGNKFTLHVGYVILNEKCLLQINRFLLIIVNISAVVKTISIFALHTSYHTVTKYSHIQIQLCKPS